MPQPHRRGMCFGRVCHVCRVVWQLLGWLTFLNARQMPEEDRPHKPLCADAKERFFWRMGERPEKTEFASLNAEVRTTLTTQHDTTRHTLIRHDTHVCDSPWCRSTSRSGRT